jgi:hypothetical protein
MFGGTGFWRLEMTPSSTPILRLSDSESRFRISPFYHFIVRGLQIAPSIPSRFKLAGLYLELFQIEIGAFCSILGFRPLVGRNV